MDWIQIQDWLTLVWQWTHEYKVLSTIGLVTFTLLAKHAIVKWAKKRSKKLQTDHRNSINTFENIVNAILAFVVIAFWANEMQNLALSIAAFMVAIVLAMREFIQCVIGFLYYVSVRPFRVGDWVKVDNLAGEVVEIDWAKTVLLEIDPEHYVYTGQHIYVPNNKLISQTVKNLNFFKRYSLHHFTITTEPTVNVYEFVEAFAALARQKCSHFREVALRYKSFIEHSLDAEFIDVDPHITVETNRYAKTVVTVSLFCPTNERGELEDMLGKEFMRMWFAQLKTQTGADSLLVTPSIASPSQE